MAGKIRSPGAPGWIVTFADLMSLLVCFFVLIISFSVPDTEKLKIAAGSIRDAFGITREIVVTGVVELDGNPRFEFAQDLQLSEPRDTTGPIPERGRNVENLHNRQRYFEALLDDLRAETENGPPLTEEEKFDEVQSDLEEAIAMTPELEALAENLHVERVPEGLRIQLLDQAKASMFPLGSAKMYEATRTLLAEVAAAIRPLDNEVEIAGHTDGYGYKPREDYDNWSLSLDRADATRRVLVANGLDPERLDGVVGRADTDLIVPDNPWDPRNRRISITLLREEPSRPARDEDDGQDRAERPREDALPTSTASDADDGGSLYSIAPRFLPGRPRPPQ